MVSPLNAVTSLLVLQKSQVPPQERGAITALSALAPGTAGLAVPFVAASAAKRRGPGRVWNTRMRAGATDEPARVAVPDVVGSTFDIASSTLESWHLGARRIDTYSDTETGVVISQVPEAGAAVALNSAVHLAVSKQGMPPSSESNDTSKILALLQKLSRDAQISNTDREKADLQILNRLPLQPLPPSVAPPVDGAGDGMQEYVRVPDLVGINFDEAIERLNRLRLKALRVNAYSDSNTNEVIEQSPTAGSAVPLETGVRLFVSKQGDPPALPAPEETVQQLLRKILAKLS